MLTLFIVLVLVLALVLLFIRRKKQKPNYKCFLLTLKTSTDRREKFLEHHDPSVPLEIIYGVDTREIENAKKYQKIIEPNYYREALRLHYNADKTRPDITYFNLGAIGCYMGHMELYRRCFDQNIKYAVIFEDNVIIKNTRVYSEIQDVINKKGDNFEMCFFHCISRYPDKEDIEKSGLERVKWISSTKCYVVHVENMKKYYKHFFPIDNHVDMKHEDIIARGARVYYKDLRDCLHIDRSHNSTIGHSNHERKDFFSKRYPNATRVDLNYGW
jgi:GR25 family glycosyltransferase involved in LPS biosynthesis